MRPMTTFHALNFSLYVGGPDVIGAQNLGTVYWGGTSSERLLFILKTYQPTIIWTSPSYAWQLGEKAVKAGYDPKKDFNIKKIIVAVSLAVLSTLQERLSKSSGALRSTISTASLIFSVPALHTANTTTVSTSLRTTSSLKLWTSTQAKYLSPVR